MIIYLYGPDSYRRQEKLNWYKEKFKEKHSALTVEHFDLAEPDELPRLKDFSTAQSLFDNFKFGVLDNVGEVEPKELDGVFKLSIDSKSLTLVISVEKKLPIHQLADKALSSKSVIEHEFKTPTLPIFAKFLKEESAKRKMRISDSALNILAKTYLGDAWGAITELEKISLGGSIAPFSEEENFFSLISGLQRQSPPLKKLPILERLLRENEAAAVFNFLASRADSKQKKIMADYDAAIKSGKLEYEEALLDLVTSY